MNDEALRAAVVSALHEIAPEIDGEAVSGTSHLREELGLDSMDFLNLVIALHERTTVDIPERDYALIDSIDSCVAYLSEHHAG